MYLKLSIDDKDSHGADAYMDASALENNDCLTDVWYYSGCFRAFETSAWSWQMCTAYGILVPFCIFHKISEINFTLLVLFFFNELLTPLPTKSLLK